MTNRTRLRAFASTIVSLMVVLLVLLGCRDIAEAKGTTPGPKAPAVEFKAALDALLRLDEGVRLRVYDDATGRALAPGETVTGNRTVGVGHNLESAGLTEAEIVKLVRDGATEAQVEAWLRADVAAVVADLETFSWFAGLDDVRRAAVVSLRFNLGGKRFRKFRGFAGAMERRDFERAALELEFRNPDASPRVNSPWWTQVGNRGPRLTRMFRVGEWPTEVLEKQRSNRR